MKQIVILLAVSAAVLVGCTKTDVISNRVENSPITYQAIQTATSTKATGAFDVASSFGSFAFLTQAGESWAANYASASSYINNDEIKFFSAAQTVNGVTMSAATWHADNKVNYWPKQGALTFFAYTPYSLTASCDVTDGIKLSNYDVDANVNVDFMVADIAADKTTNSVTYGKNGVNTLFRHKLCTVGFTIKTDKDYAPGLSAGVYAAGDKIYELKGISIKNAASTATYKQGVDASNCLGAWSTYGNADKTYAVFSGNQAISNTATAAKTLTQNTFMPQVFDNDGTNDAIVELSYTVKTFNAASDGTDASKYAVESVTETKKLFDLQSAYGNKWDMNKAISYNLTIGSDIIYWDPAVEDWTAESHDVNMAH